MPFEEDELPLEQIKPQVKTLTEAQRKIDVQKSKLESAKRVSQEDFEKKVQNIQDKNIDYKKRASDLAVKFKKIMEDKTLRQNKNIFSNEMEQEVLANMIRLGVEINNDENEKEGMGSMSWITILFKQFIYQRDRVNELEYELVQLKKKIDQK